MSNIQVGNQKHAKSTLLEASFHNCELVTIGDKNFVINELTEQVPATTPELLREAAQRVIECMDLSNVDKIVGEEEKGGILVAAVSLLSGIPFGLARWYPSGVKGQIVVDFHCEYTHGQLYLNGVEKGDKVVIVDDMISTGGTMIALIESMRLAGAEILDIIAVAEKIEYGGRARIEKETGVKVKTLLQISVAGDKSVVDF